MTGTDIDTAGSGDAPTAAQLKPLGALLPHVARHWRTAAAAGAFLLVAAGSTLALPVALRRMVDGGFSAAAPSLASEHFAALFALAALLALGSAGRFFFVIMLGERVVADLRRDVFAHVSSLSPLFFDRAASGEIAARLTADTTQIKAVVGASASIALRNAILGLGALGMMVLTSPKLAGIAVAAIPLAVLPLVAFGRAVRRRTREAQDRLAAASAFAAEQIGAIRTVQAFTGERRAAERFGEAVDRALEGARRSTTARAALTFFAILVVFASVIGVVWVGSRDVASGTMTVGALGQFLLYAVFAAGALGALSEVGGELAAAAGAAERLSELLAERPAIAAPASPVPLPGPRPGRIEFRDVSFRYPGRPERPALDGLSFAAEPGETVAIVGPSGAGKTTVLSLLLRFYDPDAGMVLVEGVRAPDADPWALRRRIAVVPQDAQLFTGTLGDNIRLGRPDATAAEVAAAAAAAGATEFIDRLPRGLDTEVGERGVSLSGGQRQRVAIARAILKDAPILFLDEATSALDAESERLVQRAMERLQPGRTVLVIAHRLATVLRADRILVMEHGRVVESGTHRELIARDGLYARLARLQFDTAGDALAAE